MKYKKYFILTGIIVIYYLLISLLYLLFNIPYNIISSLLLIFNLIIFATIGFIITKNSKSKGIIMGLKISSIFIITLLILSLILKYEFSIKNIIYYLLILLSISFGCITSKNIKKKL